MITSKNIFHHELIGLYCVVVNSSNNSLIGICGNIIDETKKTLLIETKNKKESSFGPKPEIKMIPKNVSIFQFFLPNKEIVEIDGKIIVNRPEDRIKKKYKKL